MRDLKVQLHSNPKNIPIQFIRFTECYLEIYTLKCNELNTCILQHKFHITHFQFNEVTGLFPICKQSSNVLLCILIN